MTSGTWNAEDYASNSSAQLQWAHELIAKLRLQGNESILDIGCGDGKISARLAQAVGDGKVVGIDQSGNMIALASKRFPPTTHPNLSFLRMNAANIDLAQSFDIAFSNATLHWINDHPAVLKGLRACLRAQGRVLFQMGGRGNAAGILDAMQTVMNAPRWRQYFQGFTQPYHFYGPEDYATWLPEAGFCPVRAELIPKDMQHQGTDGLLGWLRTTWFPYTDRLPTALRDPFLTEALDTYIDNHPVDAQGNTHVRMVRLEVEAQAI